jgi:hypothetical protein
MSPEASTGNPGQKRSSEIWRTIGLLREVVAAGLLGDELSGRCTTSADLLEHNMTQAELALKTQQHLTLFYEDDPIHQAYENGMVVVLRILDDSRSAPQQHPPYGFY